MIKPVIYSHISTTSRKINQVKDRFYHIITTSYLIIHAKKKKAFSLQCNFHLNFFRRDGFI
jgi:hypothetical protein